MKTTTAVESEETSASHSSNVNQPQSSTKSPPSNAPLPNYYNDEVSAYVLVPFQSVTVTCSIGHEVATNRATFTQNKNLSAHTLQLQPTVFEGHFSLLDWFC